MPYRKKGSPIWYTNVPTKTGWTYRSTGTADKATAKAMERMLADLGPRGKRRWELLEAVADGRLALGGLYDAYRTGCLPTLEEQLNDVDLSTMIADWQATIAAQVAPETARRYLVHIRTLVLPDAPFWRSSLSVEACAKWLSSRPVDRATKRKYLAAANSFLGYLKSISAIRHNPFLDVARPSANPPRVMAMDLRDVLRLVEASLGEYRPLFALMYGTGIEISVALRLTRRMVDPSRKEIRAAGKKSHSRDRVVRVAEWAWPFVADLIRDKLPDAPLFTVGDRSKVSKEHLRVCGSLGLPGYRLHDARHHWAVRQMRAGTPPEVVARQLGHANATMVLKVYGRFTPGAHDRDKWERLAAATDREAIG